jgi:hypothetical protein
MSRSGRRCPDVLEAAARAALIAEGLRIGLCEHEVRLTIEAPSGLVASGLDVLQTGLR